MLTKLKNKVSTGLFQWDIGSSLYLSFAVTAGICGVIAATGVRAGGDTSRCCTRVPRASSSQDDAVILCLHNLCGQKSGLFCCFCLSVACHLACLLTVVLNVAVRRPTGLSPAVLVVDSNPLCGICSHPHTAVTPIIASAHTARSSPCYTSVVAS